jgi:hypothetical protein
MVPDGHVCWFVVGVLGVWRVAHLVTAEDGPWGIVATVRGWAGHGVLGQLLDCFNCSSLWIGGAWALAIPGSWGHWLGTGLALSGGAILLERLTASGGAVATFVEGEPASAEDGDGVLQR